MRGVEVRTVLLFGISFYVSATLDRFFSSLIKNSDRGR